MNMDYYQESLDTLNNYGEANVIKDIDLNGLGHDVKEYPRRKESSGMARARTVTTQKISHNTP